MTDFIRFGPPRRMMLRIALRLPDCLALPVFKFLYPPMWLARVR